MSEPISPELVLVDPELARAERDPRLGEPADAISPERERPTEATPAHVRALEAQLKALRVRVGALEAQEPRRAAQPASERKRRRLASVVLPISLVANAILIAVAVAGSRSDQESSTLTSASDTSREELLRQFPTTSAHEAAKPKRRTHVARTHAQRTHRAKKSAHPKKTPKPAPARRRRRHASATRATVAVRPTVASVERKVLAVVVQAPKGKLPPRLIDRKTGLAKNGLQAICHRTSSRAVVCIVRPAKHKPGEGLYVRYRLTRNGRGAYTWYRYRTG